MDIKNKVAVITGAASGMGAKTAEVLREAGASVALLDFNYESAKNIANKMSGFAVECDVSSAASAEKAIEKVVQQCGKINICINCAGIAPAARIVGRQGVMPLDDFNRVIQVNLVGTFNMIRLCVAQMMQQDTLNSDGERGVVINT